MSRRTVRWEQAQARRYGAAIPRAQRRVQRITIKPVQLGPASSPLTPNARSNYELHEGLASMLHDSLRAGIDRSNERQLNQSQARASASLHPGLSREQTRQQFAALMEYVSLAELIADRVDRAIHANEIRRMLTQNEHIVQVLGSRVIDEPGVPSLEELEAVIVSEETARRAFGRLDTIRAQADRWSDRPWIWESRFWDVEYNQQQQMLRDRERAFNQTRIVIPKPVMLSGSDITRFAAALGCVAVN